MLNRIFSTDIWDNYRDMEEIKDTISECDFFSRPVSEISDDEAYDWAYDEINRNTDEIMSEIRTADRNHPSMWVIAAKLGLWNGTFDGGKVFKTLEDAVRAAWEDMDDFEICEDDQGETIMIGHHHDGNNTYHLRRVNNSGAEWYEENEYEYSDRDIVNRLMQPDYSSPANLPVLFGWR